MLLRLRQFLPESFVLRNFVAVKIAIYGSITISEPMGLELNKLHKKS